MPSPAHSLTDQALRVLIVDDSDRFRDVARELLSLRGYVVVGEASSAAAAISAFEAHRPDAALVDVTLPDASGGELAAHLAAHYPAVKVLLTSADNHLVGERLYAQAYAVGFVPKAQLAKIDFEAFWPKGQRLALGG